MPFRYLEDRAIAVGRGGGGGGGGKRQEEGHAKSPQGGGNGGQRFGGMPLRRVDEASHQ